MNEHLLSRRKGVRVGALLCAFIFCCTLSLSAQTDTITGVINRYTRVLAIDHCNSAMVVENPYGFSAGDHVMLIQMKGAGLTTVDSASFGNIQSNGNAGNYELETIDIIDGQTIIFRYKLVRTYDFHGLVQMVRIPAYTNVFVRGTVEPLPWNGKTGGVLALIASDTLTFENDFALLDATTMGFKGGDASVQDSTYTSEHGYRYSASSTRGSRKGESIAIIDTTYSAGRGRLASGGGGGNARSSGGGGGGNYGGGGHGGIQYRQIGLDSVGGFGGLGLTYSNAANRIYLGGGGGGGHNSRGNGTAGFIGGGIVFVRAKVLVGNGGGIDANGGGLPAADANAVVGDGAGGGGAGGAILLDIDTFLGGSPSGMTQFAFSATGGQGQSTKKFSNGTDECYGPGGGGGGGIIWAKDSSAMGGGNRVLSVDAGSAGQITTGPIGGCQGTSYGAQDGGIGVILDGLVVPEGTDPR